MKDKKNYWIPLVFLAFIVHFFAAAQPVPVETILVPRWLSSLEADYPVFLDAEAAEPDAAGSGGLLPFRQGNRFGYVDGNGRFAVNQISRGLVSLSVDNWAEYEAIPETVEIHDPHNNETVEIKNPRGYPFFLDKKIFLINNEQNSLALADSTGEIQWTHDFASLITDVDAAAGLILVGLLDGVVELLDQNGERIFSFEPGGSRLSVIYGCRISGDGSKLAIISGYDDQRFLLLERFGTSYKVIYHEFLTDGFRRAVQLDFIDNDNRVVFEREGGLGIYTISTRNSVKLALDGSVSAIDGVGDDNILFVITSQADQRKKLVAIRFPETIIMEAPFTSKNIFLGRENSRLCIGGGETLASFELDKR